MSSGALIALIASGLVLLIVLGAVLWWDAEGSPADPPAIGDPQLEQLWAERALKPSADYGLADTRAMAGKWAASAAALLGVLSTVAVVAGPSELVKEVGGVEAEVAAWMVLAAGAIAACATLLAALAEQGTRIELPSNDPALYKETIRRRANRAAAELMLSRVLTVLAVTLVIGAAGVAWLTALSPKGESKSSALVVGPSGAKCGTLKTVGGSLSLQTSGGPSMVPISAGSTVTPVDSCP